MSMDHCATIANHYEQVIRRRRKASEDEFDELLANLCHAFAVAVAGSSAPRYKWRSPEVKAAAVAEYLAIVARGTRRGEVEALCKRFGIGNQTLYNWVKKAAASSP